MPYAFSLPEPAPLDYAHFLRCDTHPSLIFTATSARRMVRSAVKSYNKQTPPRREAELTSVHAALVYYVPYLFALDAGLSGKQVGGEEVDVILENEVEVAWRPSLIATLRGVRPKKVKARVLDFELCFVLTTLGCTHTLLARARLRSLYGPGALQTEQRLSTITQSTKHLLSANSLHDYAATRHAHGSLPSVAVDVRGSVQSALASIALAEATLMTILKDDPYPAIVSQTRSTTDNDWMFKAPEIPKVRAHLFARLALAATESATKATALLSTSRGGNEKAVDESLRKYVQNLQSTARARGCRFLGIDAELAGETGKAIGWINAGRGELGQKINGESDEKARGFAKLRKDWKESREDRRIEIGGEWGADAGLMEEGRIMDLLANKWNKANDLINTQIVPLPSALIMALPSGRDMYKAQSYNPPCLDAETMDTMRAPPEQYSHGDTAEEDSDDEAETGGGIPGAYPQPAAKGSTVYF